MVYDSSSTGLAVLDAPKVYDSYAALVTGWVLFYARYVGERSMLLLVACALGWNKGHRVFAVIMPAVSRLFPSYVYTPEYEV